jgi:hypothetical protein
MKVARYGQRFKERAVARLLPPESAAEVVVALEVGIAYSSRNRPPLMIQIGHPKCSQTGRPQCSQTGHPRRSEKHRQDEGGSSTSMLPGRAACTATHATRDRTALAKPPTSMISRRPTPTGRNRSFQTFNLRRNSARSSIVNDTKITFRKVMIGAGTSVVGAVAGGIVVKIAIHEFAGSPVWEFPTVIVGALTVFVVVALVVPTFVDERRSADEADHVDTTTS